MAAAQAGCAASQAQAVAAVYEAARTAVVHPVAVAANRSQIVSLVVSNLLGQNAPAIAATEAEYEQMWAEDVAAMAGYHGGASAAAAQLSPWGQALQSLPGPSAGASAAPIQPSLPSPAQGITEYGAILAFLASLITIAITPPQPLSQAINNAFNSVVKQLNAIAFTSESVLASQSGFNQSELANAQAVTSNNINRAVSALGSGNLGGAAAYLAAAGLYDAGTAVNLVGSNAVLPLTLLGADLQALGTALAP
ncbi:hypothetical protein MGAST_23400 [Mycobacterium gastri 'Wayne']|nr:hypothetical protein MGAST_23400 [Mycobacterium gastri 'Wayne']